VNQYDAPVLALTQESNNLNVHKSDLIQVQEYAHAVIVYLRRYVADIGRLNSTTEPQGCSVSVRLFSILNIGSPLFINSSLVAGFENLPSCGIRVCMTSAIYKQLKKTAGYCDQ
jgi:hypothetical protein